MNKTKTFSLASIVLAASIAQADNTLVNDSGVFHNISPDMPMMCYQGDVSASATIAQDNGSCIIYDCTVFATGQFLQGQACEKPGADNPTHIELDKIDEVPGYEDELPIRMGYQDYLQQIVVSGQGHVRYDFPMFFDTIFKDGFEESPFYQSK